MIYCPLEDINKMYKGNKKQKNTEKLRLQCQAPSNRIELHANV